MPDPLAEREQGLDPQGGLLDGEQRDRGQPHPDPERDRRQRLPRARRDPRQGRVQDEEGGRVGCHQRNVRR